MILTPIITILIFYILKDFLYVAFKILTRSKSKAFSEFTGEELASGFLFMKYQIIDNVKDVLIKEKLLILLNLSWNDFRTKDFTVDGATFIKEQSGNYFNLWWFIHDWRNWNWYVGTEIDSEMLDIMTLLNVPQEHTREALWWFRFTWINKAKHILKKTYRNDLPNNLTKLY